MKFRNLCQSIYQLCVNLSTLSLIFILLFSYINCSIIIQQDNYVFTTEGLLEVAIESRKLAWMGFESTTTEFCSDAWTNWAIRPWVQLALRANFVQLLQFHLFVQCSHFILAIAFISHHSCFKRNLTQFIMLVAEWIDTYGIHHWRIFEVAIVNWLEWDLNPWPLISVQML